MDGSVTTRFGLPLLHPGQAQKEMFHNEAIALIDLIAHPAITAMGLDAPPADGDPGAVYIVGPAPAGDWSGKAGWLAGWSASGWRFAMPVDGMRCWSIADALWVERRDGAWVTGRVDAAAIHVAGEQVVGARQAPIAAPEAGDTVDAEARLAIDAILGALRSHGLISTA